MRRSLAVFAGSIARISGRFLFGFSALWRVGLCFGKLGFGFLFLGQPLLFFARFAGLGGLCFGKRFAFDAAGRPCGQFGRVRLGRGLQFCQSLFLGLDRGRSPVLKACLLYTSDAADE